MGVESYYESPDFAAILTFVDAIFSELNIGLLIYHVEDPEEIASARLIYANKQASRCTATDLRQVVGKRIFDAFPRLQDTGLPQLYSEVIKESEPRRAGLVEYGDQNVQRGRYATRAFPMPRSCLGVIFENVDDATDVPK